MPRPARPAAAVSSPSLSVPAAEESASGSSAERSLRLLALLASEGRALTLADLAAQLGLPKGTAHRICTQLLATGFLARDVDERSFSVGPALRKLAFDTLNHGTVRGLRHEVLSELVRQVGETCNLTTLDGAQVLYLDRVEAKWPLRLTLDVGSHVPLHCTASGKLLLAQMPKKERDALIDRLPLARMTANTLVKADALRTECDAIARRGYSRDCEEFIAGLVAVAVPVRDAAGQVRAALAVHAPTARMSMEEAVKRIDALKAAAERMGTLL
ncbi:IclR family transcriptional regulator [Variovorax paradoxus]|uniref:IclR family transcriptional regulator n=1 Tax=Variovorax paradoxus TaxID=34073 RepID=UPI0007861F8C|nr:IclR family transcriptional regulator [Variovorax paradoxus]